MCARKSTERLRSELRDYYGTAMFNGNPMAMIELEEVERASDGKLRDMARKNGIDTDDGTGYGYGCGYGSGYGGGYGGSYGSGSSSSDFGISITSHTQTLSPAVTRFFDQGPTHHGSGFFGSYARSLQEKASYRKLPQDTGED